MDCDLARLLLLLPPRDLAAADSEGLARHLDACPTCAAKAADSRHLDAQFARAFAALPPPVQGRAGAMRALRAAEATQWRAAALRLSGIAAALVLVAGLALGTVGRLRPTAEGYRIAVEAGRAAENPEADVQAYFAERGLPALPMNFDYANYVTHGRLPILDTDAPAVAFAILAPNGRRETATAFALTPGRFQLSDLQQFSQASFYNVTVIDGPAGSGVRWAIVHTTPTLVPFERKLLPPDA